MRTLLPRLGLLALVLLAPLPARTAESKPSADAAFEALADDFLRGYLAWRPGLGVSLGLHEYDGRITDVSRASVEAEIARLKDFARRLDRIRVRDLSPRASHGLRLVQTAIRRQLFQFEDLRSYSHNPMTYAGAMDVNIYVKRDFASFEERVRHLTAILEQAPAVYAAARANLADRLARPHVETAIQVAEGSADFLAKDLVVALEPLKDPALRRRFEAANTRAVAEVRGYAAWLKETRLPRAHDRFALGRAKFARMLRDGELISESPEAILKVGLRELRAEQDRLAAAARLIDPAKKPLDVIKAVQRDHPTEQSLIPDTRQNLEAIRQFLVDRRIITIPSEVRAKVDETPKFARATSFASMDTPGPFETRATEAYYYVTPVEPEWPAAQKEEWLTAFNYYTTDIVSIHEAYPGHYLQFLCLNASPANRLEKILDSYAFIEGWAHYTEQMMMEEGFGPNMPSRVPQSDTVKTAKYQVAQSVESLLRLCRLVAAIRMHCQDMSVDEATRFFVENCYYEEKPARQEAVRGTYDPEYLYYTVGKLQFLKLREDWKRQEGAAYSLQRFHDEALRHGMPPVRLLRELMLKEPKLWDKTF
ncbi:MAG: hypothetical protein RJA22_3064 [Verrucomicrobiota bacterium]